MAETGNKNQIDAKTLRQRAEDRMHAQPAKLPKYRTADDTQRLVHELEVYQIELEMQNIELRQSRTEVESALERYTELYDFSPAGYFTLDRSGIIRATNLTGSIFLGTGRAALIGRPFSLFVAAESRPVFSRFLGQLFTAKGKNSCELILRKNGDSPIIVQLAALASESGQECRVAVVDISKRKEAEEALLVNKNIYRAIGESIDYGIWICDPEGRNIYASQSFLNLVGISQEQCSNFGWGDVLHPDDAERTIAAWKECVRTGNAWDIEHRFHGADGRWHNILARGLPVRNDRGDIIYWAGINLDISQLKATEQELRQSEKRYRVLAETMLQGVVHQDVDGTIISMNPAAEKILGKCREEFIGNNSVTEEQDTIRENGDFFPGMDHPTMVALRTGLPIRGVIMGVFNPVLKGYRWISIDAVPVFRTGENMPSEVYSIFEDITERRQSKIKLQESEQRIQQALHVSRSFTFDWQPATDQVTRSASCSTILKLTGDEAVNDSGVNFFQCIHPDDRSRFVQLLGELTPAADSYTTQYRYVFQDGNEITLEETGKAFFDTDGTMLRLVGVTTDITVRKELEQALQLANEELEQRVRERTDDLEAALNAVQAETTERLKIMDEMRQKDQMLIVQERFAIMGEMINNIAHQWRQPLNSLGLIIQKLPFFYGSAEFDRKFLEKNTENAMQFIHQMSRTIDDFKNFFKSDKKKVNFSVGQMIHHALTLVEPGFKALDIKIVTRIDDDVIAQGFPNEYAQVLLNILMNSRDALIGYGTSYGTTDEPLISIHAFSDGCVSVVTIGDNAGGIDQNILDRLFDPYFTTKGPDKGTGIGLYMSKIIVEKNMGGSLTVRNTGRGAEFRIEVECGEK